MIDNNVCAVVVTFHPDADVLDNLARLRPQVQGIVVVDNGSSPSSLSSLRTAASQLGFELIENGENLGIAAALNTGVRRAEANGFAMVILFDQDSAVTEGFMDAMLGAYQVSPERNRLAILVPRYVDKRTGAIISQRANNETIEGAMTSGSLMRTDLFHEAGYFQEELFIDGVDYEYSLRLRDRGYRIAMCHDAVLLHSPGNPTVVRFGGIRLFQTGNYGPLRRYYQDRNRIWIIRQYWRKFPLFCLRLLKHSAHEHIKTIIGESEKFDKTCSALRGTLDGLRGRMGRAS